MKPYLPVSAFRIIRGGFTAKLRKLKLQGLPLTRAPSRAVGGALVMCLHGHMFLKTCKSKVF